MLGAHIAKKCGCGLKKKEFLTGSKKVGVKFRIFDILITHLIRGICLLFREFVVVSQLKIFLLELLGSAEKPMAGPSNSERKNRELRRISNCWW